MRAATALLAVAVAALVGVGSAECPNQCSGHGRCTNWPMKLSTATTSVPSILVPSGGNYEHGYDKDLVKKDSCTCFTRKEESNTVYAYKGADCSQRTCPHGASWAQAPSADNVHNVMEECSGRGVCDTSTGTCKCFPGFTGKGCRRAACPNDCSGHGRCKTLNEIATSRRTSTAYDSVSEFDAANILYGTAWDADKMMGCECDSGFRGSDCSLIECPSTTDPMGGLGAESGLECSGRGNCDYNTGSCKCFDTYGGDKCEVIKQAYL